MKPVMEGSIGYGEAPEESTAGPRRLLSRLLLLAILDALERREPKRKAVYLQHYRPDRQVLGWFKSRSNFCSPEHGVSFEWLCEQLDLPSDELREAVLKQHVALIRSARSPIGFFLLKLPGSRLFGLRSATSGFTSDNDLGAKLPQLPVVEITRGVRGVRVPRATQREGKDA